MFTALTLLLCVCDTSSGADAWVRHDIGVLGSFAHTVVSTDLSGDGIPDVLTGSYGQALWWRGGNDSWTSNSIPIAAGVLDMITARDMDADGRMDVLCSHEYPHRVSWYRNLGGGTQWQEHVIFENADLNVLTSGDLDNDGDIDLLSAGYETTSITWHENSGGATAWVARIAVSNVSYPYSLRIADLNADGRNDVAAIAGWPDTEVHYWSLPTNSAAWEKHLVDSVPSGGSISTDDVQGDGRQDILASCGNQAYWWDNLHSPGTNWNVTSLSQGRLSGVKCLTMADLDADGDRDFLLVWGQGAGWLENRQNTGIHCPLWPIGPSRSTTAAACATDVDGDGDLDVWAIEQEGLVWWENRLARIGARRVTPYVEWTRAWGSPEDEGKHMDDPGGVACDAQGNALVVARTMGVFHDQTNTTGEGVCLTKIAPDGRYLWTRIWGQGYEHGTYYVATDSTGSVYAAGVTDGTIDGLPDPHRFRDDFFLTKFDAEGRKQWSRLWGSAEGHDSCGGVTVDRHDNVYVVGHNQTAPPDERLMLTRFSPSGEQQWTRDWVDVLDRKLAYSRAVCADIHDILYIAGDYRDGYTWNDLFLTRYDVQGNYRQTVTWGDPEETDHAYAVAVDSTSGVYVAGYTFGSFGGATNTLGWGRHAFISKLSSDGTQLWTRIEMQFGGSMAKAICVDDMDNIYVAGLSDTDEAGASRVTWFLMKLTAAGETLWTHRRAGDRMHGAALDNGGAIFLMGTARLWTTLCFDGQPRPGGEDLALTRWVDVDRDDDRLLDSWERQFFGDLVNDGLGDADEDGLSDRQEYEMDCLPLMPDTDSDGMTDGGERTAGTDPLDPRQVFNLRGGERPGTTMSWQAATGRIYTVYTSTHLTNTWQEVMRLAPDDASKLFYTNNLPGACRYFRVGVGLKP